MYVQKVSSARNRGRTRKEASEKIAEEEEEGHFARIGPGSSGGHRADHPQGTREIGKWVADPLLQVFQKEKEETTQETDTMIERERERENKIAIDKLTG